MNNARGWITVNIEYLREFTELAKHLNFTETARLLNMSQPTLSKHIGQLERESRLKLFHRAGNTLRLTRMGATLLPYAYQVIDAQNDFMAKVAELRKAPPPRLTISGLTDEKPSTEVLGFLISILSEQYGSSFLEVKSQYNHRPVEMLAADEVDIVYDPAPENEGFDNDLAEVLHVADLQLVAVVDSCHPLANLESVTLDELSGETILKFEGLYLSRSWSYIERACGNHGFTPRVRSFHCASVAELFSACTNLGSSVLLVGANFGNRIPSGINPFCRVLPVVDEDAVIPFFFIYRKDSQNPILKDAVEIIKSMPHPPLHFK